MTFLLAGERAFIWNELHGMRDLGSLGGDYSSATGINDAGQDVGYAETALGGRNPFIWDEVNGMRDLGPVGPIFNGQSWGEAKAINNFGPSRWNRLYLGSD